MRARHGDVRAVAVWCALVGCALVGCGPAALTSTTAVEERFEAPEAADARRRAPDLYAAAMRAFREARAAERAGDVSAAEDHATRARLLLEAAIVEADRLALQTRRLEVEERLGRLSEGTARDARARIEIEVGNARRAAAQIATEQRAAALAEAEATERRRYRNRADERESLRRQGATILLDQARLVTAAAEAMGAQAADLSSVTEAVRAAEQATTGATALASARRALFRANAVLGTARSRQGQPGPDEVAALVEDARAAGFEIEQLDRGLAVRVRRVFSGSSSRPTSAAGPRLEQLQALLGAHPHGAVQLLTGGGSGASGTLAEARVAAVAAALAGGDIPRDRLSVVTPAAAGGQADPTALEAVFVAYAPHRP